MNLSAQKTLPKQSNNSTGTMINNKSDLMKQKSNLWNEKIFSIPSHLVEGLSKIYKERENLDTNKKSN